MPIKAGKVIPNWRPQVEYYRGLYIELALATELGFESGFLQKHQLQAFTGFSVARTNFNYLFQKRNTDFVDINVGFRRKLSKGAFEIRAAAGSPLQSAATRYTLGLAYVFK